MGHHHSVPRPGPHDAFDVIVAAGNYPGFDFINGRLTGRHGNTYLTCADGFQISILAGPLTHSTSHHSPPWTSFLPPPHEVRGPYISVECGLLSARPEPWDVWQEYANGPVFSYVPVPIVRRLLDSHGGARRARGAGNWKRIAKALAHINTLKNQNGGD